MDDTSQAAPKSPQTTPHAASDHGADALPPTSAPSSDVERALVGLQEDEWNRYLVSVPEFATVSARDLRLHRLVFLSGVNAGMRLMMEARS